LIKHPSWWIMELLCSKWRKFYMSLGDIVQVTIVDWASKSPLNQHRFLHRSVRLLEFTLANSLYLHKKHKIHTNLHKLNFCCTCLEITQQIIQKEQTIKVIIHSVSTRVIESYHGGLHRQSHIIVQCTKWTWEGNVNHEYP
jgi:hypothetical protein